MLSDRGRGLRRGYGSDRGRALLSLYHDRAVLLLDGLLGRGGRADVDVDLARGLAITQRGPGRRNTVPHDKSEFILPRGDDWFFPAGGVSNAEPYRCQRWRPGELPSVPPFHNECGVGSGENQVVLALLLADNVACLCVCVWCHIVNVNLERCTSADPSVAW